MKPPKPLNTYKLCKKCGQPILRKGETRKNPNEYQHASGCPAGPAKNPAAVSLGRRGGKATAAKLSAEERSESASNAAASRWAAMTPAQRSAEMKRRAKRRKNKTQKKETRQ